MGKAAGRSAREPRRSLVNEVEKPTLWSEGEGRWRDAGRTEVVPLDSRGGRVGMFPKIDGPVLEIHSRGWGAHRPSGIRQRKPGGLGWKSEGFIVPVEVQGQQSPRRGKGPCFLFRQPKSGGSGDCQSAHHPGHDQDAPEEALGQGQAGTGLIFYLAMVCFWYISW